jgi:hypothetical protein
MFHGGIRMATDAGIGAVRRGGEFGFVHEQGNCLPNRISFKKRVVRVAIEAIAVPQARPSVEICKGEHQRGQQYKNPSGDHIAFIIGGKTDTHSASFGDCFAFFAVRAGGTGERPVYFKRPLRKSETHGRDARATKVCGDTAPRRIH